MPMTPGQPDPLADVAADEQRRTCVHPHLNFGTGGGRISCIDCGRYWLAGYRTPQGEETLMTDMLYANPRIGNQEFRHSPNVTPRREPSKLPDKKIR